MNELKPMGDTLPMRALNAHQFTLEPQTALHAPDMFVVLSDPAIYEFENAPPASAAWLGARFARLESRGSTDGQAQWLNWVIRLPSGELMGYVQATVRRDDSALIAYELASRYWGQDIGSSAVALMIDELAAHYNVRQFWAVLKRKNFRSQRLLERLQFTLATAAHHEPMSVEADEILMGRALVAR
jgi:[ribosomal protein S5]-alanine N-acetyltransferase